MEQVDRDLIRSNLVNLIGAFSPDIDGVCNYLQQYGIIIRTMKEDILSKPTESRQAAALLEMIPKRGPNAFEKLYEAANKCMLYRAQDILRPENSPHEPPDEDQPLPEDNHIDNAIETDNPVTQFDEWRDNGFMDKLYYNRIEVKPAKDQLYEELVKNNWRWKGDNWYPITRDGGEKVVFFLYDNEKPNDQDFIAIQCLFSQQNIIVTMKKVNTNEDMNSVISIITNNCEYLLLFVYATGDLREESGLNTILNPLKTTKQLVERPKVIFYINKQLQEEADDDEKQENDSTNLVGTLTPELSKLSMGDFNLKKKAGFDSHDGPKNLSPDSDFLVVQALPHGQEEILIGDKQKLTRFFISIVYYMSECACSKDLSDILSQINISSNGYILHCHTATLRKRLRFF